MPEDFQKLMQTIHKHLEKRLQTDLKQYTLEDLHEAITKSVTMYHDEEVDAYLKMKGSLCSNCGMCCQTHQIVMSEMDVFRLSREINPSVYIKPDPERKGRYNFKEIPCSFHQTNNRCSIYNVRPQSCRNYPLTVRGERERMTRDPRCNFVVRFFIEKTLAILSQEEEEVL